MLRNRKKWYIVAFRLLVACYVQLLNFGATMSESDTGRRAMTSSDVKLTKSLFILTLRDNSEKFHIMKVSIRTAHESNAFDRNDELFYSYRTSLQNIFQLRCL